VHPRHARRQASRRHRGGRRRQAPSTRPP
jgi:hypothetical protein